MMCLPSEEAPLIPVRSGSVSVHSRSFHGSAVYSRAVIALLPLTVAASCFITWQGQSPLITLAFQNCPGYLAGFSL